MGIEVKLPNLGEGADSGTVVSILVKPGAPIQKGQNVIELETGKAVVPIPSPEEGTVQRIAVKDGDKITVGQLILVLEGAAGKAAPPTKGQGREGTPPFGSEAPTRPRATREPSPAPATSTSSDSGLEEAGAAWAEEIISENPVASPHARQMARDLDLDLRVIQGKGRSGQIQVGDIREYIARLRAEARASHVREAPPERTQAAAPAVDFSQWGPVTRKPMSPLRKRIAQRMVASATSLPVVTQFDEADVTWVDELRRKYSTAYESQGVRLTPTSFVLKAVAATLRRHPILNASLDAATDEIVLKDYIHLGIAVDTEAGLLVPVLRDADTKDLRQLSKETQELAARARDRKLGLPEMQGGTFTISNQGGIGSGPFTPIINPPEVGILGMGRSAPRAVVRDGQVTIRTLLPLALTYDHRVIDGAVAARFMVDLVAAVGQFAEEDVKLST